MAQWHTVTTTDYLREGSGMSVVVPGRRKPIALFKSKGEFFAIADECSHAYSPMSVGSVADHIVTCPWHGAKFDVRTGKGVGSSAYPDIRTFPVRLVGQDVQVEV